MINYEILIKIVEDLLSLAENTFYKLKWVKKAPIIMFLHLIKIYYIKFLFNCSHLILA